MKTDAVAVAGRLRTRRTTRLILLAGFLAAGLAQGQQVGPQVALGFDSGQPATARALEQAIREGDPWEQLDWTFTLRPSVLYRQYLDERGGDLLNPRLSTTLQVRFGERPLDTVRRAARLERALRAHDRAKRLETRDALLAFAELLLAQDAHLQAAAALEALPDDAGQAARLSAELDLRTEENDLDAARRAAAGFGITGQAVYESLRFEQPAAPRISELSAFRLQQLVLAEAETRFVEAGGAGILNEFRLGVGYRTDGFELDLEAGLMAGRPGLRLGTIHPGGRARMEVRVSAELAFGDQLFDRSALLEDVEIAQQELERLSDSLRAEWLAASAAAELAEEALSLDELFLEEARVALLDSSSVLSLLPAGADGRERERAVAAVERAEREVARLTTRVHRSWIHYVRRHHDLLLAAEAGWQVRE